MLPIQSVWGGATDESLPARAAPRWKEADDLGFKYAHGDKRHWSSRETTKKVPYFFHLNAVSRATERWVEEILDPYVERQKKKLKLPESQKSLLLLDAWKIHTAKSHEDDFIPWMKRTHPNIILLFIPGGCKSLNPTTCWSNVLMNVRHRPLPTSRCRLTTCF
jgi:hypothetical protein